MPFCRTLAEILAAADAASAADPPLSQDQADMVPAILAPYQDFSCRESGQPDAPDGLRAPTLPSSSWPTPGGGDLPGNRGGTDPGRVLVDGVRRRVRQQGRPKVPGITATPSAGRLRPG
jgi:hypothetical protein